MLMFNVFSIFSVLGATFTLILWQFSMKNRNFGLKYFIITTSSIFVYQMAMIFRFFFDLEKDYVFCDFQAFLLTFSEISIVLMTGVMSYSFYESIVMKNAAFFQEEQLFQILGFGYPLIIALMYI